MPENQTVTKTEKRKKILLTGGGTAGHVTPNLALLPELAKAGFDVVYAGSKRGMERELAEKSGLPYRAVSSGKLRRYLSVKSVKDNFTDAFRVAAGFIEARAIIKEEKPDIVFSKGGFVAVPVVIAASLSGTPVVIHESDITPGLANKICCPFADAVCVSFPETLKHTPGKKSVLTGAPVRAELLMGNREKGRALCGFNGKKPVVIVIGGSSGSARINECVAASLGPLLEKFDAVHICGKGNAKPEANRNGYIQFEYVSDGLPDLFALADIAISRAGANTLAELFALKKPNLLIPLSRRASRGDQIANAESYESRGFSSVLPEERLTTENLLSKTRELYENREAYIKKMIGETGADGVANVVAVIADIIKKGRT